MPNLPSASDKYYFEVLKNEQKAEMLQFLMESFRVDEPLNRVSVYFSKSFQFVFRRRK